MKRCLLILVLGVFACTTQNLPPPTGDGGGDGVTATNEVGVSISEAGTKQDGFSCAPNAFLGCKAGTVLMQCNADGNGTLLVDCSPYLCDATNKRCTQCDPNTTPVCQGSNLLTCTADGLLVTTTCPSGCANGICTGCTVQTFFKDGDGDGFGNPASHVDACTQPAGYVTNSLDCDDLDAAAHPGQTAFFDGPTKGTGNFDYNCNKVEEQEEQTLVSCVVSGMNCIGDGWTSAVPACGTVGVWERCNKQGSGPAGCGTTSFTKTQRCH